MKFLGFHTVNTIPGLKSSGKKSETYEENQMKWTTEYTVLTSMDETGGAKTGWLLVSERTRLLGLFANHCCRGTFAFVQHQQNPPAFLYCSYTKRILVTDSEREAHHLSGSTVWIGLKLSVMVICHFMREQTSTVPDSTFTHKRLNWINQSYGFQVLWDQVPRPITSRSHLLALVRFEPDAYIRKVNLLTTRPYACIHTDIHLGSLQG